MVLFLVPLYVWRWLQKTEIFKKEGKCLTWAPRNFVGPLWVQISKFSKLYDVGTLNLYLRMPGTMQKESAQSDHPARRKRPKCGPILLFQNIQIFMNVLDVFSGQGDLIELIPCALCQASRDTSLEYPHHIIWNLDPKGANQISGGPGQALSLFFENFRSCHAKLVWTVPA